MFSVIIPLYNKTNYIEKCLLSVLKQTCNDFEIIVINDGSTDDGADKVQWMIDELNKETVSFAGDSVTKRLGTEKNISRFESSFKKQLLGRDRSGAGNIKIQLINQENCGVSVARNNGVEAAKNDYIAFLDADDWWVPTYLEEMSSLITDFPEAGIYSSSYFVVKNGLAKAASIGMEDNFNRGIINYYLVYAKTLAMPVWTGATIIKKKVFESENGFKSNLILGEDFDLWIRLSLKHPVAFLNNPLAYYNQDVDLETRGVVDYKIYHPNSHYIFNLDYLEEEERNNEELKKLLDKLRVYTLYKYHLQSAFINEYEHELKKVNFDSLPFLDKFKFQMPLFILRFWQELKGKGSELKSRLLY